MMESKKIKSKNFKIEKGLKKPRILTFFVISKFAFFFILILFFSTPNSKIVFIRTNYIQTDENYEQKKN